MNDEQRLDDLTQRIVAVGQTLGDAVAAFRASVDALKEQITVLQGQAQAPEAHEVADLSDEFERMENAIAALEGHSQALKSVTVPASSNDPITLTGASGATNPVIDSEGNELQGQTPEGEPFYNQPAPGTASAPAEEAPAEEVQEKEAPVAPQDGFEPIGSTFAEPEAPAETVEEAPAETVEEAPAEDVAQDESVAEETESVTEAPAEEVSEAPAEEVSEPQAESSETTETTGEEVEEATPDQ